MSGESDLVRRISRWEALREIKNLTGKYSRLLLLAREHEMPDALWSVRDDIALGLNDGYYTGRSSVAGYYSAQARLHRLRAELLQKRFPQELGGKNPEELRGIGGIKLLAPDNGVIEIAADGLTAKGLWTCFGEHAELGPCGPVSNAVWGWYAIDYILENGVWKLWHLCWLRDMDRPCELGWRKGDTPAYPELPEFAALKHSGLPKPDIPICLREMYHPGRGFTPPPRMPEPYASFSKTFSYGPEEVTPNA